MIRQLNTVEKEKILSANYIGYLSYIYHRTPFIVPITFFYSRDRKIIIGYSGEGHKINALRQNPNVSLCVTDITSIDQWKSILVHGKYSELNGSEAKSYLHDFSLGVKNLIEDNEKRSLDFINQFSSKISEDDIPIVFLIHVEEVTGKIRLSK